jgi:hypothetical protein
MDLIVQKNAVKLIGQISDNHSVTAPIIPYAPQKATFNQSITLSQPFPRKSPESVGVSSEHIAAFLSDLKADKSLSMHSITILCSGAVISEANFGAYKSSVWHITNSLCKSITGLAIGMLIDEGRLSLDSGIVGIFEKKGQILSAFVHRNTTVRHLLTMSSGVVFNEAGSLTEEDWIKCFFESALTFAPGKSFSYNSMNSYILSAIVRQISGQSLMEYLRPRLFEPLGIQNIYWEACPKGIEKGGWGLYILPEDAAKIGMLFLRGGVWNGKRIISEEWIKTSTQNIMKTSAEYGDFDYGYHLWVGKNHFSFLFNGMYGQNVLGFFDSDVLIVSNAGNDEFFQKGTYYDIAEKYFGSYSPAKSLPKNPSAESSLRALEKSLKSPPQPLINKILDFLQPLPPQCAHLDGKTFTVNDKSKIIGLFPLMAQVLQNNFSQGIKSLSFSVKNNVFTLIVEENDAKYEVPIGFGDAKYSTLDIHGEPYILGTQGVFRENEDGNTVLKLTFSFLEISNSRNLKLTLDGDNLKAEFIEHPGLTQIKMYMASLGTVGKLVDTLFSKLDPDFLDFKLKNVFEPTLTFGLEKKQSNKL